MNEASSVLDAPAAATKASGDENHAGSAPDQRFPFEAMKLKVGDRLQLQLPEQLSRDRVLVRLIGYVNNLSLLVTMPRQPNGLRAELIEGDMLVARVFSSQNAFGFSATVDRICKLPFEYVHLSFPAEVTGVVIRKAPRVRTRIICSVVGSAAGADGLSGVITNLSANGALLDSRQALAGQGETVRLSFRLKPHAVEAMLTLNATVRTCYQDEAANDGATGLVHHGLEFSDLQPNDALILQSTVYQLMVEHPKSVL